MLIKCAFVGQKTLIFIEMHGTTTTKNIAMLYWLLIEVQFLKKVKISLNIISVNFRHKDANHCYNLAHSHV
jgi:hypothetical protein